MRSCRIIRSDVERLRRLAERIDAIAQRHPSTATTTTNDAVMTGWFAPEAGLARGVLHEWIGICEAQSPGEGTEGGATQAEPGVRQSRGQHWSPPLGVLVHLAWRALAGTAHDTGTADSACNMNRDEREPSRRRFRNGRVMWIGRDIWPYGRALLRTSPDRSDSANNAPRSDERLLNCSIYVDPPDDAARLWAIDLALRSPAVTCVIADARGMAMAESRRLQLAAQAGGALALLVRPPWEAKTPSVAATRWRIARARSPDACPRFLIELVRCKGVQRVMAGHADITHTRVLVEWDRAQGCCRQSAEVVDRSHPASISPADHAVASGEAESPARIRRTG